MHLLQEAFSKAWRSETMGLQQALTEAFSSSRRLAALSPLMAFLSSDLGSGPFSRGGLARQMLKHAMIIWMELT